MPRPPNLLFLWTDEQRHDTLAVGGNRKLQMPNLNRLAERSTAFTHAYCTQPVCTPSRGCIMSGLYPHAHGAVANNVPIRPEVRVLPEWLPPGQYASGYIGKWHLGDELFAQHGFEEWVSVEDMYNKHFSPGRDRKTRSDYCHWLIEKGLTPKDGVHFKRGESARLPEAQGKPAFLAEKSSEFIRRHKDHPFALYVNFLEPHMPFFGPRDEQYPPDKITLPINFENPPAADQPLRVRLKQAFYQAAGFEGNPLQTEADWRKKIAQYWGLCSLVDTHMGTILKTLEDEGLFENTLIVFTSDHGDQMGSHRFLAKSVMFEESTRIPLLMKLPGQRSGCVLDQRVSQIDLLPTLLEGLGVQVPDGLHGQSRLAWLEGKTGPEAGDVHSVWRSDGEGSQWLPALSAIASEEEAKAIFAEQSRTVVTQDGWRFTWSDRDLNELYNLNDDPGETRNLAAKPEYGAKVAELSAKIRAWQERTKDELRLTNA